MSAETKCIQVFILKMASLNNEGIMKQVNVIRKSFKCMEKVSGDKINLSQSNSRSNS